ncbi:MAG: hypothetical protein E5X23_20000 [Mesorhizobium sp.]|nr:hypothetical protein EJ078_07875 [Mesorhizobium sp. M1A.F.Ca.IN.022.06.1.1]RUV25973.1 hypothetical protein EOA91_06395 [Mesorhizobium sp. M1A.F.Ca.IN.022.04.1.1]RUV60435.1 hypothetical protein EOA64_18015 [Mesorhizobium sp. M1A.F.Ca.IN.022.02.1.1]RUV78047.1 hypothetical protein EOA50_07155 [Mesorhizobium sp. M1A.F.Ca.IN.020.30.1.1]RWG09171.1 MAG: hypothetical protein EOQ53_22680 [Mesorhizobium sp.]TGQ14595.1 hypothetical protein EN860_028835 [Mesorhizobium sp. M00.F.Ca.ET.217.01.1.1]TGV865
MSLTLQVGAAPHLPAGILSPYSDGERGALANSFANRQRCKIRAGIGASPLLPVSIRGEVPGRAMRGSAALHHDIEPRG